MNIGFVTCVQLGLSCMEAIYESGGKLCFAMTLPDDRAVAKSGRVFIDDFCSIHNIPLFKSAHVNNTDVIQAIKGADIDWLFIVGWSQIASIEVLGAPRRGVLGMHPTLLPVGRGRAAIPWAILKGLEKTGVTLFKMDQGVDTGPIAAQVDIPVLPDMTAADLYQAVDIAHVQLIRKVIPLLLMDRLHLVPQDESKASIWPGRRPEDGEIDLSGSVYDAERLVRAVTRPYPGAYFFDNGVKTVIWAARIANDMRQNEDSPMSLQFRDGVLLIEESEVLGGEVA
jgi:methionyl-tRNA formyltransferase